MRARGNWKDSHTLEKEKEYFFERQDDVHHSNTCAINRHVTDALVIDVDVHCPTS